MELQHVCFLEYTCCLVNIFHWTTLRHLSVKGLGPVLPTAAATLRAVAMQWWQRRLKPPRDRERPVHASAPFMPVKKRVLADLTREGRTRCEGVSTSEHKSVF